MDFGIYRFLEPIPCEYPEITVNKADDQLQTDALKKIKQGDVRERDGGATADRR